MTGRLWTDEPLTAALTFAANGWPVFPCSGKVPLTAHGVKDATTDRELIESWWRRWPYANLAVATGAPGPDVLDVDTKDGRDGADLFDRARRAGLLRGAHAVVVTPSGGWHVYFAGTAQRGGAVGPARDLELKAAGGYVLTPPSTIDGRPYRWHSVRPVTGTPVDFAAIRRFLQPRTRPTPPTRTAGRRGDHDALVRFVAAQAEGNRNAALYWAGRRAAEAAAGDDVFDALLAAAVSTGLPADAARLTVDSARQHRPAVTS